MKKSHINGPNKIKYNYDRLIDRKEQPTAEELERKYYDENKPSVANQDSDKK